MQASNYWCLKIKAHCYWVVSFQHCSCNSASLCKYLLFCLIMLFLLGYEFNNDRLTIPPPKIRRTTLVSQYSNEKYYWEANHTRGNMQSADSSSSTLMMRVSRRWIFVYKKLTQLFLTKYNIQQREDGS